MNYEFEPMRYYQVTFSINEIIHKIEQEIIVLNKSKYRKFVWNRQKQSLFIDSILRGFPTPPLFLYQESDRTMTVIDGVQRLHTIYSFYRGEFKLINTTDVLRGKSYYELSYEEQHRFHDAMVNIVLVDELNSNNSGLTDLFYRLNIGGEKITNQEIRNRLYYGEAIEYLNELNSDYYWRVLYGKEDNRLKDVELILKFMTYMNNKDNIYFNQFEKMNEFLDEYRNNPSALLKDGKLFLYLMEEICEEIGQEALKLSNRTSSVMFDLLVIPLGLVRKNGGNVDIKEAYKNIIREINEGKIRNFNSNRRIAEGLNIMEGYYYDI